MRRLVLLVSATCFVACGGTSFTGGDNDGGTKTTDSGVGIDTDAGIDAGSFDGGVFDGGLPIDAMPPISFGVHAFASSSTNSTPATANSFSAQPAFSAGASVGGVCWASASLPATLAYDLSAAPSAQRQEVLLAWYAEHAPDYLPVSPATTIPAGDHAPVNYTIEINAAAGGGAAPTSGWSVVETVTGNNRNAAMFTFNMSGANWVRMNISTGTDANVCVNMDVYSAPSGGTDAWLFLGDSISHLSFTRAFSDLPGQVHANQADRWPAIIEAAVGGSSTVSTQKTFDAQLSNFPGRFVALSFGTNDVVNDFEMETLVLKVLAVGKTPVIPHMPWAPDQPHQAVAAVINPAIDALYAKYPQILKGPDLYTFLSTHQSDILAGDIHPNEQGKEDIRGLWAVTIESVGQ